MSGFIVFTLFYMRQFLRRIHLDSAVVFSSFVFVYICDCSILLYCIYLQIHKSTIDTFVMAAYLCTCKAPLIREVWHNVSKKAIFKTVNNTKFLHLLVYT